MSRGRAAARLALRGGLAAGLAFTVSAACHAGSLRYCDAPAELSLAQRDRLLRFAAIIKSELDASGGSVALVARSGLDLGRFGMRYSHAGLSLKASDNTPWSVRQLYYACDERRPRVFDQGIPAFLLGLDDPSGGYVSAVLLPGPQGRALEHAALDKRRALQLLGASYSANAHAFSLNYQNCNQWVAELMATAWGGLDGAAADGGLRGQAQRWLKLNAYEPSTFDVSGQPLVHLAAAFIPWLHRDDHPPQALERQQFRVSMPASIEAFVRNTVPGATRLEFCHAGARVVVRRGWEPIAEGCTPGANDTVVMLD